MRHCSQCGQELHVPPQPRELRLRTSYAPADLAFCSSICLVNYLLTAPEHVTEIRESDTALLVKQEFRFVRNI